MSIAVMHINDGNNKSKIKSITHLKTALQYICNPEKTNGGLLVSGLNCAANADETYYQFMLLKENFNKTDGVLAYHWDICFAHGETYPAQAMEVAREWAQEVLGDNHQCLIAVHDDKEHIHAHLIFNSVGFDGYKWHDNKNDLERKYYPALNRLCVARGLSYVDLEQPEGEKVQHVSYKEWLMQKKGYGTWKDMIKADIDHAIGLSYNFEKFITHLEDMGYDVNLNGKYLKVRVPGMEKWSRVYSLGAEYSEQRIRERIRKSELPAKGFSGEKKIYRAKGRIQRERTPLTKFQRYYLRYMYLLGNIKRQPYRRITFAERQQSLKIAEQMNYMFFHNIGSMSELKERKTAIEAELVKNAEQRRALQTEQKKYSELFRYAKEYRLSDGTDSAAADWLTKKGYEGAEGLRMIGEIKAGFTARTLELREQRKDLDLQNKMIDEILNTSIDKYIFDFEQELEDNGRDYITAKERSNDYGFYR